MYKSELRRERQHWSENLMLTRWSKSPWLHFLPSLKGPWPPSRAIVGKRGCPCGWSGRALLHLAREKATDQLAFHRGERRRTTSRQNGCISDPARSVWPKGRGVINKNEADGWKPCMGFSKALSEWLTATTAACGLNRLHRKQNLLRS